MLAWEAAAGLAAYWVTVRSVAWIVRQPWWVVRAGWVVVPALCLQFVAWGVIRAAPPALRGGINAPWPVAAAWAVGVLAIAAVAADPAPRSGDEGDASRFGCLGYGLVLLIATTYLMASAPGWEFISTLVACVGMLVASVLVRFVRELWIPRASSVVLDEFAPLSDETMPGTLGDGAVRAYAGPYTARPVAWPQWPADPGAWFVEALQDVAGPNGELRRPAELAKEFEIIVPYAEPVPAGYARMGTLPAGLQTTREYWGKWLSRLTCSAAGLSVGALVAASLAGQGAVALLAWALGIIGVWMISAVVGGSPRLARLGAIADVVALIAEVPDIPIWSVPEPWRNVTVTALLADVPASMPCKQTCHACLGSGHAQTTHPVAVVVQEAHTTTEWVPSVGSEGGREVTVHHPEIRRTQWVPDQCSTCDGEGYTVGEWPSAVVREHALGITAWVSTLVAREPSIQDGIQARNERLASARAEAERWKATAESRSNQRLTPA